ncbi:MAG: hypothetical protein ACPGID_05900 [Rubricella sp.]
MRISRTVPIRASISTARACLRDPIRLVTPQDDFELRAKGAGRYEVIFDFEGKRREVDIRCEDTPRGARYTGHARGFDLSMEADIEETRDGAMLLLSAWTEARTLKARMMSAGLSAMTSRIEPRFERIAKRIAARLEAQGRDGSAG